MHTLHIAQGLKAENEGYTLSPVLLWSQKSLFLSITLVFLDLVLKRTSERPPKQGNFLRFCIRMMLKTIVLGTRCGSIVDRECRGVKTWRYLHRDSILLSSYSLLLHVASASRKEVLGKEPCPWPLFSRCFLLEAGTHFFLCPGRR